MKKYLLNPLRGIIAIIAYSLNIIVVATLVVLFGLLIRLIPSKRLQQHANRWLHKLPLLWSAINNAILAISLAGKLDIRGDQALSPKNWYLMIANHQTWIDILIINRVFLWKTPLSKFFMKKELLWSLPIAGLACYLLGYPFMERHTRDDLRKHPELKGKDIETTRQCCEKFKAFPCTMMNFVEGTRFSKKKAAKQKSPHQHLLKPKAGGTSIVLTEMKDYLSGIVNVTIHYEPKGLSLWQFLCGNIDEVIVNYEVLPVTPDLAGDFYEDRVFRKHFQAWITDIWSKKDALLAQHETGE